MRILITGRGTSGSWQIRGVQLGEAIGADVKPKASAAAYDLSVLVKRPPDETQRSDTATRLVWDVVDAWPQPRGNLWSRGECLMWLTEQMHALCPRAVVAATKAMAADLREVWPSMPVLALPHHARPGLDQNPIRERVEVVGYEGSLRHLGVWADWLRLECARRGWRFAANTGRLADCDIVVAVRQDTGYAPRNWKSNVKLANAQGSGTPIVMAREAGYIETASGFEDAEQFADTQAEFVAAFDRLEPHAARLKASALMHAAAPSLESVAQTYRQWLSAL